MLPRGMPNTPLLQSALDQTQGPGRNRAVDWRRLVRARLADLDADRLARDVRPFLERPGGRHARGPRQPQGDPCLVEVLRAQPRRGVRRGTPRR